MAWRYKNYDDMDKAREILREAARRGACSYMHGVDNMEDLVSRFYDVPVWEFCIGHDFPALDIWRGIDESIRQRHGIHVDEGRVSLRNPESVILAGGTDARLTFDGAARKYMVFVLQGAKARIRAGGFAVVFVKAAASASVYVERDEHGICLVNTIKP